MCGDLIKRPPIDDMLCLFTYEKACGLSIILYILLYRSEKIVCL